MTNTEARIEKIMDVLTEMDGEELRILYNVVYGECNIYPMADFGKVLKGKTVVEIASMLDTDNFNKDDDYFRYENNVIKSIEYIHCEVNLKAMATKINGNEQLEKALREYDYDDTLKKYDALSVINFLPDNTEITLTVSMSELKEYCKLLNVSPDTLIMEAD